MRAIGAPAACPAAARAAGIACARPAAISVPGRCTAAVLTILLVAQTGCQAPQPAAGSTRKSPAVMLRDARGDLDTGRFIRVADFELPGDVHGLLLHPLPPDPESATPPIEIADDDFGGKAMRVRLSAPEHLSMECGGPAGADRPVDWRPYTLLLMSVRASRASDCEVAVECEESPRRWMQVVRAAPRWNLVRVDLADVAESVDLSRIRRITWRLLSEEPTELWIDDVILSDNRKYLLGGDSSAGDLYVCRSGRYLSVGVRRRFELSFDDGVIARATFGDGLNVSGPLGLGPWPMTMNLVEGRPPPRFIADPAAAFERDDRVLFATETVEEASPLRVVVVGEWRFLEPGVVSQAVEAGAPPGQRWRYTIHRSGQVFIESVSHAPDDGWLGRDFGYSLTFRGVVGRDAARGAEGGPRLAAADPAQIDFGPGLASNVCWAMFPPMTSLTTADSDDGAAVSFVATGRSGESQVRVVHALRWSATLTPRAQAEQFAALLTNPPRCDARAGRLRTDAAGDSNADGFNEAEGCFELALEDGLLRCVFDAGERMLIDPMFRVESARGRPCWIYANGRAIQSSARDAEGRVLFSLPGAVRLPLLIEINAR